MSTTDWRGRLLDEMPPDLAEEIDIFEGQMELRRKDKIEDRVFAETRLRRGAYGQRYDNGQRHDGVAQQTLTFPAASSPRVRRRSGTRPACSASRSRSAASRPSSSTCSPSSPRSTRTGSCTSPRARTSSSTSSTSTTRPTSCGASRRSASPRARPAATRCATSPRCPLAGVCRDEAFDVTPYANALFRFLLGHPDCQDFGRKFKIAFSGCARQRLRPGEHARPRRHRPEDRRGRREQRGFELYVGGGLGAVPHQAKLFDEFVPEEELLPIAQAICPRLRAPRREEEPRRARIKFLVTQARHRRVPAPGADEERQPSRTIRAGRPTCRTSHDFDETPLREAARCRRTIGCPRPRASTSGAAPTCTASARPATRSATVTLPLGDITSDQARALADVARKYDGDAMRTTVEQNIVLRWVREPTCPALYSELEGHRASPRPAPGPIVDITACPGTDTCKLGIASSRGLAGELRTRLAGQAVRAGRGGQRTCTSRSAAASTPAASTTSPTSASTASAARSVARTVPHFQVVLGGAVDGERRLLRPRRSARCRRRASPRWSTAHRRYVRGAPGRRELPGRDRPRSARRSLEGADHRRLSACRPTPRGPVATTPTGATSREFTIGDIGVGECAGEVVSLSGLELSAPSAGVRRADRARRGRPRAGRRARLRGDARRRARWCARRIRTSRTTRTRSSASSRSASSTPSASSTGSPRAVRAAALRPARRAAVGARRRGDAQRVEEAQLFIDAARPWRSARPARNRRWCRRGDRDHRRHRPDRRSSTPKTPA